MQKSAAFTLIELSIVLVIIGLIVGGVLVGRDLINAAAVRAQATQIEKYNSAVNTFYGKFGYLPGDIPAVPAAQFGFAPRGQYAGEGDGNGVIEGIMSDAAGQDEGPRQGAGETVMFWVDLSTVNLVDGAFSLGSANTIVSGGITPTNSHPVNNIKSYFPPAKIGSNNFIYVYSLGGFAESAAGSQGVNFFGMSNPSSIDGAGGFYSTPAITVQQAYSLDSKIDDGLPQSGRVTALYDNYTLVGGGNHVAWAAGGGVQGANASHLPTTTATPASATTCYDNGGVTGTMQYSMTTNNGAGTNCALSFRMQGGN